MKKIRIWWHNTWSSENGISGRSAFNWFHIDKSRRKKKELRVGPGI